MDAAPLTDATALTDAAAFENEEEVQELYEHFRFTIDKGQTQIRIDKYLSAHIEGISRSRIQAAADADYILVNEKAVKSSYQVKPLDQISIVMPYRRRGVEIFPENIPLDVVYEDDELMVVNKPAGLVVHPGHGNYSGTLVNALAWHLGIREKVDGDGRMGLLVHRIDKNTSGLLVVAKTDEAQFGLSKQFFNHTVKRQYLALVWGNPSQEEGTISYPIGRDPNDRVRFKAFPQSTRDTQGAPILQSTRDTKGAQGTPILLNTHSTQGASILQSTRETQGAQGTPILLNTHSTQGTPILQSTRETQGTPILLNTHSAQGAQTLHRHAVTHYRLIERFGYVSLLACHLETGRTHQIRVHAEAIGHPLFNDERYGGDRVLKGALHAKFKEFVENCFKIMPRHALHAETLGFIHPKTKEEMLFSTPLPSDFQQVLDRWRRYGTSIL